MTTHTELAAQARRLALFIGAQVLEAKAHHHDGLSEAALCLTRCADALESPERLAGGGEPIGFMNAGHVYELQQKRLPYGYIYPEEGPGAHVAVFTTPPPQAERVPLSDVWIKANHDLAVENHALKEHIAALNRGESPTFDPFKGHKEHQTRQTPYGPATSFQAVTPEPNCRYPDCKCPTESPCLQGLPPAPLSEGEIRKIWVEHGLDDCDAEGFARAIERAHGITPKEGK